jgi:hypothetical protein
VRAGAFMRMGPREEEGIQNCKERDRESLKLQAWGVSIGTNMKPIPPIHFFKKRTKIGDLLVLRQDGWHERSRSTYYSAGTESVNPLPALT